MSYKAYKNKLNVELKEVTSIHCMHTLELHLQKALLFHQLLNERGLKVGGNKSDLIERLRADDKARKAKKQKIKIKRKLKVAYLHET